MSKTFFLTSRGDLIVIVGDLEMTAHRTVTYRLYPRTRDNAHKLAGMAGACREVWNHFVGELIDEYIRDGKCDYRTFTLYKQFKLYRKYTKPWLQEYSMTIVRESLKPIELAYKEFFKGKGAGLPKFKAKWEDTPSIPLPACTIKQKGKYLHIEKLGWVKLGRKKPNPYPNSILKSGTVKFENGKWWAYLVYEVEVDKNTNTAAVGIDMNTAKNGLGIADTNGFEDIIPMKSTPEIPLPDFDQLEANKKHHQRRMAKCRKPNKKKDIKPSKRWLKHKKLAAKEIKKKSNAKANWCHQVTRQLANKYGVAGIEDLKIKNMTKSNKGTIDNPGKNVKQKSGLARSILSSGWGQTKQMLNYKMAKVIKVDPKYTSQRCNKCGHIEKDNRKEQAEFECLACGHQNHADKNAARNVLDTALNIKASGIDAMRREARE